jgi:hypothetical protein
MKTIEVSVHGYKKAFREYIKQVEGELDTGTFHAKFDLLWKLLQEQGAKIIDRAS